MSDDLMKKLEEQEKTLIFDSFTRENAFDLGNTVVKTAKKKGVGVSVEIIVNGLLIYKHSMEGATGRHDIWLKRKANTVNLELKSSLRFGEIMARDGRDINKDLYLSYEEYAIIGGGFPIFIRDVGIVGSISVSGLAHVEDHNLVIESIKEYLNK